MEPDADSALMTRYAATDDRAAFEALFRGHAGRLQAFFLRGVGNEAHARDLVQQTFLHLHRARRDFRAGAPFRPWLNTIAVNVRRQHLRTGYRHPEIPWDQEVHGEPSTGPRTSTPSERLVRRALEQLPDGHREVILLHWYEGLSYGEIGEMVGATESAVKLRAHRAYERLRGLLGEAT